MNVPTASEKRLVLVGASGMVGGYALRCALENSTVGSVTSIGRKKLDISHPKLNEVLHPDFADCSALAQPLTGQDAAIFCLGVYTGAVPDSEFRKITVDYTIEFARILRANSPAAAFSFLSGMGPTKQDAAGFPSHAIKERPRRRCWRRGSIVFTYSAPPTSIPWSRGRNRISVNG